MIILFCGIPGSGKTTIAEILATRLSAIGRVKLSTSDRMKPPVYRRMFQALEAGPGEEDFLILDATFYKTEWRDRVAELAAGRTIATIYLHCPREVALQRNRERALRISDRARPLAYHRMQPPIHPIHKLNPWKGAPQEAAKVILPLARARETH